MPYGPIPHNTLPEQDSEKVMRLAERFAFAASGMREWAATGKECYDFLEGRQWTEAQLAAMRNSGRVPTVWNELAPLVRLVIGFFSNNRTDITFRPGNDGPGSDEVGQVLTSLEKSLWQNTELTHEDAEMFLDGIVTGRGYMDTRLDFEDNMLGEIKSQSVDPFSVYLDPEADSYNIADHAAVQSSRWVSVDEIEYRWGKNVRDAVDPFMSGETWSGFTSLLYNESGELGPLRYFGQEEPAQELRGFRDIFHNNFIDTARKNVRVLDTQAHVYEKRKIFVDLDTGDTSVIPKKWGPDKIAKVMHHAGRLDNELYILEKEVKRVRWTQMVGDIIIYDEYSPYDEYTLRGFFPYFRRGITRGMLNDLIDPQRETNKKHQLALEIIGRSANGGLIYDEDTFKPDQEAKFRKLGSRPGIQVKKQPGKEAPQPLKGGDVPKAITDLLMAERDEIRRSAGINDSAMGEDNRVQSGKSILAKQRQSVTGLQMYMQNWSRTKRHVGLQHLNLFQKHYTEQRMFRVLGEDGKLVQHIVNEMRVNPQNPTVFDRINDITLGKYVVSVDETPIAESFQAAQFEEAMMLIEKFGPVGLALLESNPGLLIDMSSMPRKEEWKQSLQKAAQAAAQAAQAEQSGDQVAPPPPPQMELLGDATL